MLSAEGGITTAPKPPFPSPPPNDITPARKITRARPSLICPPFLTLDILDSYFATAFCSLFNTGQPIPETAGQGDAAKQAKSLRALRGGHQASRVTSRPPARKKRRALLSFIVTTPAGRRRLVRLSEVAQKGLEGPSLGLPRNVSQPPATYRPPPTSAIG